MKPCRTLLVLACLAALLAACAGKSPAAPDAIPPQAIAGTFHGNIWSGDMTPGDTTFFATQDNQIAGEYSFQAKGKKFSGTLGRCQQTDAFKLLCRWQDDFGTGDLRITFSNDYKSFDGSWNTSGRPERHPWNGSR